jgi:ABC-type multidrug transport system fused ATPase/permease subunit
VVNDANLDERLPGGELKIMRALFAGKAAHAVAIGALAVLSTAGTLALPLVVARLLEAVQENRGIAGPAMIMVAVGLGAAVAGTLATYLLSRLAERLICRLRIQTMRKSLALRLSDARREGSGNLATRLAADVFQLKGAIDIGPIQLPMALVTLAGTLVIMGFLDWVLLLITLGGFLTALWIVALVVVGLRRKFQALQVNLGELVERFVGVMDALPIIKAYRAEDRVARDLAGRAEHLARLGVQTARMESLMVPAINLGQHIALLTVLIGGGARLLAGHLTLADFVAFLLYLLQLTAPLIMVASGASNIQAGMTARRRFNDLFALPSEDDGTAGAAGPDAASRGWHPDPTAPAVRFERVSFSYGDEPVLRDVSLTVPAVGLTAMVGPSGAGKSTVLALVERFVTPGEGRVEVFGRDAAGLTSAELRGRIAYVDQSFTLLRDTVRANLTLGHDGPVPDEALLHALRKVGLEEEVLRLPDGLDTVIGGENDLSGGQRQRLALARAILADTPLVLLDEPTSQLDSVNEVRLRQVVDDLARDRAVLVVAHRLSTVQHAGQVIVLDRGRVLAAGTHDELLSGCAAYAELVNGQLLGSAEAVLTAGEGPETESAGAHEAGRPAVARQGV